MEKATFGAGCFWGVQAAFQRTTGVINTIVGYTGGQVEHPSYRQVCSGRTGHAEVCQVEFDPTVVSYEELLKVFFSIHNPTTLNRQGPDIGAQYRSVIFYEREQQKEVALALKEKLDQSGTFGQPIVTEISAASQFWPAEEGHQDYYKKHGYALC